MARPATLFAQDDKNGEFAENPPGYDIGRAIATAGQSLLEFRSVPFVQRLGALPLLLPVPMLGTSTS